MPRTELRTYDRGRIVGRYLGGQPIGLIATIEGRANQTVSTIIHCDIRPDGHSSPPPARSGPERRIQSPTRRLVLADIDQNRHVTTKTIVNDHHISRQSVYSIALSAGLRSDKEELVPDVNMGDEGERLDWCNRRAHHDPRDFIYTDEVGFTVGDYSQDTYVFRTPPERLDRDKTKPRRPTFRQVMVWGAVAHDFKPPLFVIPKDTDTPPIYPPPINPPKNPVSSTLNQVKYAVWILQGHVWPMVLELRRRGRQPVVVEDNARPHDGEVPKRIRQQLGITRFPHPKHSPDLNAIENCWSILKRRIEARRPAAKTRDELIIQIHEEWALVPMEVVNASCESIERRVQEVRDARGYATGH